MRLPQGRERLIGCIALGVLGAAALLVGFLVFRDGSNSTDDDLAKSDATPTPPGLLTIAALPGSGWTTYETELVTLDDSPLPVFALAPDLPECATFQDFESTLFEHQAAFTGGQSRLFERPLTDGGILRVTKFEATFSERAAVAAILAAAQAAIEGPEFASCMLAAASLEGIEAAAEEGPPLMVPPTGVSRVLRYTATAASGGGTVTQAVGWWSDGERLIGLVVSAAGDGPDDAELAAVARAATGARP